MIKFTSLRGHVIEHLVGMSAQVASAVPLVLITAVIAHTRGLHQAGGFTVAVGLSAFIFAPAAWGMRTHIVIDNLNVFSANEYIAARALTVAVASVATFILAIAIQVPTLLALGVVLMRVSESVIDLDLAFTQVWHPNIKALTRFALLHIFKLIAVAVATGLAFWLGGAFVAILIDGAALVAVALSVAILLVGVPSAPRRPIVLRRLWSLFGHSKWFASANIASAGISSAPRICLPLLYNGDVLGVIGVSLSIGTFFGMAFYTTLLRFLPVFSTTANKHRAVAYFLLETIIVMALSVLVSWAILPQITAIIFGFHDARFLDLSRDVLVASVFFAAGMNLTNLYKVTARPWGETMSYALAIPAVLTVLEFLPGARNMPAILTIAGAAMACASVPALFILRRRDGVGAVAPRGG